MKELGLMGHIVCGFPSYQKSLECAEGIILGGAEFLEVQFPFSDSNADGISIQRACEWAIKNNFKIEDGFNLINSLSKKVKIIAMTYANIIFGYGINSFLNKIKQAGAWGIIVPDLPLGEDEGLRNTARNVGIEVIELITPNMSLNRMKEIIAQSPCELLYVVARMGITGKFTHINENTKLYLHQVRTNTNKRLAVGFGIKTHAQVQSLLGLADLIVAGSYFVQEIEKNPDILSLKKSTQILLNGTYSP